MNKFCKYCNAEFDTNDLHWYKRPDRIHGYVCRIRKLKLRKENHKLNKIRDSKANKNWYNNNKIHHNQMNKDHYETNKSKILENHKKWRIKNPGYNSKYNKHRSSIDINYKLSRNLRTRLNAALRNNQKVGSAVRDLGCTVEFLKQRLELQFQPGMTWENYGSKTGQWSIDHIIPLSRFDLTNRIELLKACHYTNLQPMWHIENLQKGNK